MSSMSDKSEAMSRLSDGELIHRVQRGNLTAFDVLVTRYRPVVLYTARVLLRDWEQAEDAAQQALLEAFRCLPGLQDAAKFRPWLMTITRRCALRRRATREPVSLEFSEAVINPLASSAATNDEMIEQVKASLIELSSRNRQVMTLHYLDGYSCREIGQRLHIPAGTVKRILHESRNSLRADFGVMKGDRELMVTASQTQKQTGPRDLVWWVNGSWSGGILRGALSRSVCLAINKTPKTIKQIARDVEAHSQYVLEALNPLVEEGIVAKLSNDRYLDQFIAMDAQDWMVLTQETQQHGSLLADAVIPHLPVLEEAWNRTTLPSQGFNWMDGIWPTLAFFVFNAGTARHGLPQPEPPVHTSGHRCWLGCHETVDPQHDRWSTGFNSNGATGNELAYGYWWSPDIDRIHHIFDSESNNVLGAVGNGAASVQEVAAQTGLCVEPTREILAQAIELGLVTQPFDKLTLTFPIIREADSEALYPTVDAVTSQLTSDVLRPCSAQTAERLKTMGYEQQAAQFPVWRGWMENYIAGECLRELVRRRILPALAEPIPINFCMVGWYSKPNAPRVTTWEK